jgi:hypothetical protein
MVSCSGCRGVLIIAHGPYWAIVEVVWLYRTLLDRSVCLFEPLTWGRQPVSLPALIWIRCIAASYQRLSIKTHESAKEGIEP